MGNSFQDQLLKAGLVDQAGYNKANKALRKRAKQKRRGQAEGGRESAAKPSGEQAERDRELNLKREQARKTRELEAQVQQMIDTHRVEREEGDIAYHFSDSGRVVRIHLSPHQRRQLVRGGLRIVRQGDGYELLPSGIAEKILQRDPSRVIPQPSTEEVPPDDDYYRRFQVPDDLIW